MNKYLEKPIDQRVTEAYFLSISTLLRYLVHGEKFVIDMSSST